MGWRKEKIIKYRVLIDSHLNLLNLLLSLLGLFLIRVTHVHLHKDYDHDHYIIAKVRKTSSGMVIPRMRPKLAVSVEVVAPLTTNELLTTVKSGRLLMF